jgi:hypothetical protein
MGNYLNMADEEVLAYLLRTYPQFTRAEMLAEMEANGFWLDVPVEPPEPPKD